MDDQTIEWLLGGDVAIQYQTRRDLLDEKQPNLQKRIESEGWGERFLALRNKDGHWGRGFYVPKWTSSHYTLLDLKHLNIAPDQEQIRETIQKIIRERKSADGGINPSDRIVVSDICINGMLLTYACYFGMPQEDLESVIDYLIQNQMGDGGFNCLSNRTGAVHSSLHSTISVLEGMREYKKNGYTYRLAELEGISEQSIEFILQHRLYKSDKTGEVIDRRMLLLSFPSRWYYDILRALDYFQSAGVKYDPRMEDGLDILRSKRRRDGTWPVQNRHPGESHFEMEKTGGPSRWNTLRALRVFRHFGLK
jgi:hypothetical protein